MEMVLPLRKIQVSSEFDLTIQFHEPLNTVPPAILHCFLWENNPCILKAKNIQTPKSKVLNGNRTNAKAENLSRTTTHYCKSNAYTFKPENPNQTNWSKGRESSPSGPMPNYRSQAEPRVSIGTQAQENRFQIKESLQRGQLYKLSLNMRSICLWQLTVDRETSKSTPPPQSGTLKCRPQVFRVITKYFWQQSGLGYRHSLVCIQTWNIDVVLDQLYSGMHP